MRPHASTTNKRQTSFGSLELISRDSTCRESISAPPHAVGKKTNLRGADFSQTILTNTKFGAAELQGANFAGANLTNATFTTASLVNANLTGATLTGSRFYQCHLDQISAPGVDWSGSDITGSSMMHAELDNCKFSGFKNGYWFGNFSGSTLSKADFSGVNVKLADFSNADLSGANFNSAMLEEANFTGADLNGTSFDGAYVRAAIFAEVKGLEDKQRNELLGRANRWHFDATNNVQWFFDSLAFPAILFFTIPILFAVYRRITLRSRSSAEQSTEEEISDGQFKLSTLLWVVFGVGLYFGVGVWSLYGLYWLTMMVAFFVLIERVVFHQSSRKLAGGILAFAVGYASLNIAFFVFTAATDPFLFLNLGFMAFSTLLAPLISIIVATVVCYRLSTIGNRQSAIGWPGENLRRSRSS
jgi:uncharacterized protein YjbI with pentapeptide repeats/uncharacterized membrane protein YciS (DUF1049 family)